MIHSGHDIHTFYVVEIDISVLNRVKLTTQRQCVCVLAELEPDGKYI